MFLSFIFLFRSEKDCGWGFRFGANNISKVAYLQAQDILYLIFIFKSTKILWTILNNMNRTTFIS